MRLRFLIHGQVLRGGEMTWNSIFATGVEQIDSKNKDKLHLLGNIQLCQDLGISCKELKESLSSLEKILVAHFRDEEKMLVESGCPDLAGHAAAHQNLLKEVGVFRTMLTGYIPNEKLYQSLSSHLVEKVTQHILSQDAISSSYLRQISNQNKRAKSAA